MTLMARQLGCHSVMDRASYTMMRTRSAQQFPFHFVRKTPNNFFDVRLCESPCDCIVSVSLNKRTSQTRPNIVGTGSDGQRSRRARRRRLGTNHTVVAAPAATSAFRRRLAAGGQVGPRALGTGPHPPAWSARFVPERGRRGSAPPLIFTTGRAGELFRIQICLIPMTPSFYIKVLFSSQKNLHIIRRIEFSDIYMVTWSIKYS